MGLPPSNSPTDKPRDRQFAQIVQLAFDDFRLRERAFYLDIGANPDKGPDPQGKKRPTWWYAANNKHAIEVLLTLTGLKPCTLLVHGGSPAFNTTMVQSCLLPVFETHSLASYGFQLVQVSHAGPTSVHWGFKDAWILADTRSPVWPEVQATMLAPRSKSEKMDETRIGRALGYPVSGQGSRTVVYMDEGERRDLSKVVGEELDEVVGFEFFCGEGSETEWKGVMRHYLACMKVVQAFGGSLTIDLSRHPKLDEFFDKTIASMQSYRIVSWSDSLLLFSH